MARYSLFRLAAFFALFTLGFFGGCDSLPIDPYITFNVTHVGIFQLSPGIGPQTDSNATTSIHVSIDSDYTLNGTSFSKLKTSQVDKVILQSSDAAFKLENLIYAQLLIGADTVAFDSIPKFTGTSFQMTVTHRNVVTSIQDTLIPTTLRFKLKTAPQNPVTISATMTIIHTAEPL